MRGKETKYKIMMKGETKDNIQNYKRGDRIVNKLLDVHTPDILGRLRVE